MKRKIFLILMVLLSFATSFGQNVTLSGSVLPFPKNVYNPGEQFTVNISFDVNGGAANNVLIYCDLPSTIVLQGVTTTGIDPITHQQAVIFSRNNVQANSSNNSVQFSGSFLAETFCTSQTAVFSPIITADGLTPFYAPSVTITSNANYGVADWEIYQQSYKLTNANTGTTSLWLLKNPNAYPLNFPFFSNGCSNCADTFYLPMDVISSYTQKDISNAMMNINVNQSADAFKIIDNDTKVPLTLVSTATNSCTYSYRPNNSGNNPNYSLRLIDYIYYKNLEFIVNPSLFTGQSICISPVLTGVNCDGSSYSNAFGSQCLTIPSQPAQIVLTSVVPLQTIVGCDYSIPYSLKSDGSCNQSCPQTINNATAEFNPLPKGIHVNSITVPDVTGTDVGVLTGHYYCQDTHTTNSFSFSYDVTYLQNNANTDEISLSQLVGSGCSLANTYITDYKIATTINTNAAVALGKINFTLLSNEWQDPSILITPTHTPIFSVKYSTGASIDSNGVDQFSLPVYNSPAIYSSVNLCDRQTSYCYGDTVNYSVNIQNQGWGSLYKGKVVAALPTGFKYVPNSASLKAYSDNQSFGTCICPSCGYTNLFGNSGVDQSFSADFSQDIAPGSSLTWTVGQIKNACVTANAPIYNLTFKAVITPTAVYIVNGNLLNVNVSDSSFASVVAGGNNGSSVALCPPQAVLSSSEQVSLDNNTWVQDTTVVAGQRVYYKIVLKNEGNVALANIKLVDILPAINDPTVNSCDTPRNSTAFVSLIQTLTQPVGVDVPILYSVYPSPVRYADLGHLGTPPPVTCENGSFVPFNQLNASIQNVRAFEINYGDSVLLPGDSAVYIYSALVPIGPRDSAIANNSFAVTETVYGTAIQLPANESQNVTLTVVKPSCQCVEGTVWIDSIPNGVQDSSEIGINGINISILDSATGTLKGSAITTYDINKTPGHYQFCSLPPGSYYVTASIPDSLIHPPKPDSAGVIIADTLTIKEQTASFIIDCSKTTSNVDDIIIRTTTDCDDDCSKRRPILFKPLFR